MKKIKKTEKNKRNLKKHKILRIISLIILIIVIMAVINLVYSMVINNKKRNNTIIAKKTITTEFGKTQEIKYIIKMEDYKVEKVLKEIVFETEEEANLEYNRYEIINKYEGREFGLELKEEKLILTMTEKQLKLDVNYKKRNDIIYEGEEEVRIDQEELKKSLINQGYQVK